MKQFFPLLLFLSIASGNLFAQSSTQLNSAEILLALKKLNTVGSVLYVAAHPDDENTRLLGYLSKEKKLRTGYISITRGDGGQNLIGKEQSELLGLIRTQELLAARKTDGAEQFFTRANDFGYSKNPEETFTFWNKDSILADMVWTIRQFKPDIIICRFPTTGEGGHGHHTASAILALEAFDAAADPQMFPQQLIYTEVWQAKRIVWNTFNFGGNNTTAPDQLKLDVGIFNPLLGKGYGEIASESRTMHKSQGFGSAKTRGTNIEYFKLLKGDSAKTDLFEGINQTWSRLDGTAKVQSLIDACIEKYDMQFPEKIIDDLVEIYSQIKQLKETDANSKYWKQQKLKETEALLLSCSGLWLEASAADYIGIPGKKISIAIQIINRNNSNVKLNSINYLNQTDTVTNLVLKFNELVTIKHDEILSPTLSYSNPYWLNEKHDAGIFTINNQLLIGTAENYSATNVVFHISINNLELEIIRPLVFKQTDPVKGEVYRPFELLPLATINISEKVFVFSDTASKKIHFTIKANASNVSGTLQTKIPAGWNLQLKNTDFNLINKGDEVVLEGILNAGSNTETGNLKAALKINELIYTKSIQRIEYDHIPYQFILSDAESKLVSIDLKKIPMNIGYIPGAGDDVAACLNQIGFPVTELTDELIANENLSKYNTIITGIRAYNTNDRLQVHYNKLMEYVSNGGNLIVQYNTNSRVGPFPFTISRERVTDENATVRIVKSMHPAITFPNKISGKDFEGWIQERGIYFASEIDSNYQTFFSMNDAGEKELDGSLIIAKYGKGNFVYTGLAFFRELPAGVPGAYRIFTNLICLPKNEME